MKRIIKMFSNKESNLLMQVFRFVVVGFVATIIDFLFLLVFKEMFKIDTLIANTLSFSISTIYNYIASVVWVFNVDEKKKKTHNFILFVLFSVIGLLLNNIILGLCTNYLKIYYVFGKVLATLIVMTFNFITRKKFLE